VRFEIVAATLFGLAVLTACLIRAVPARFAGAAAVRRVRDAEDAEAPAAPGPRERLAAARRRFASALEAAGRSVSPGGGSSEEAARRLQWAGIGLSPAAWNALPYFLGLLGLCLGVAASAPLHRNVLIPAVVGGMAGVLGPSVALSLRLGARRARIAREILAYSEYLAMAMRAGAEFNQAVVQISERFPGPVADAFAQSLRAAGLGERLDEGLRQAGRELENPDADAVIDAMRQGQRFGAECADFITNTVQGIRRQRVERVLEKAGKSVLLMLMPIVIFYLPVIFALVIYPMMHQAMAFLHPAGVAAAPARLLP
jgi:tight adherence protein C